MAVDVNVSRATAADCRAMAPLVRAVEVEEVRAATGQTPGEALFEGLLTSDESHAIRFDGELACMFGVVRHTLSNEHRSVGVAWLLTSNLVERKPKTFWQLCLLMSPGLLSRWDYLVNAIDIRHEQAIRWGRRLGFELDEPQSYGSEGHLFAPFRFTKEGFACARQPS